VKILILVCTVFWQNMPVQKIMVFIFDEMVQALDKERKTRKLETIPEAVRSVLGEYFKERVYQTEHT
jgi:hypothetical protein